MTTNDDQRAGDPSIGGAIGAAAQKSSLKAVASDDLPSGQAIISAIGGVRGLVESVLPSFLFLVVYLIAKNSLEGNQVVLVSSLVPLAVAIVFIVIRAATKLPVAPAVTGAVFVAITAILAIGTDRAENNFVLGLVLNGIYLAVILISLAIRRPIIAIIVAQLLGERAHGWREIPRQRRMLTLVTWMWAGMFAVRLIIELPMYLAGNAAGLAVAKLILGVPFYAAVLWVTWLLVRAVFPPQARPTDGADSDGAEAADGELGEAGDHPGDEGATSKVS